MLTSAPPGAGSPVGLIVNHVFDNGPNNDTISVGLIDGHGVIPGAGTLNVSVTNVAPTAVLNNFGPVNEGSQVTVLFTNQFDPSNADTAAGFHYAYDFGDTGTFNVGNGTYAGSVTSASESVPANFLSTPGLHVVRARIIDQDNGFTDYTTTVQVNNVAPIVNLPASATAGADTLFTSGGNFVDPGSDIWTALVDYNYTGSQVGALHKIPAKMTSFCAGN